MPTVAAWVREMLLALELDTATSGRRDVGAVSAYVRRRAFSPRLVLRRTVSLARPTQTRSRHQADHPDLHRHGQHRRRRDFLRALRRSRRRAPRRVRRPVQGQCKRPHQFPNGPARPPTRTTPARQRSGLPRRSEHCLRDALSQHPAPASPDPRRPLIVVQQAVDAGVAQRIRFARARAEQISAALDRILTQPDYRAAAQHVAA